MSRRLSGGNSPEADGRSCASPSLLVYRGRCRGLSAPAPLRSRAEPPLAPHRVLAKVLRLYQVQTPQLGLVIRAPCLGQGLLCALCCGFMIFFFLVCFCFVNFFFCKCILLLFLFLAKTGEKPSRSVGTHVCVCACVCTCTERGCSQRRELCRARELSVI